MKKYKKPVLDIVEFDNLDVIIMSNPSSDSVDEESGAVLMQTYSRIDDEGNSEIGGAENQSGEKDDSSAYDNTVGDNDSLDNTVGDNDSLDNTVGDNDSLDNTVGDNDSSDNTVEDNNPLDDTSDQDGQIDTTGGTDSEDE